MRPKEITDFWGFEHIQQLVRVGTCVQCLLKTHFIEEINQPSLTFFSLYLLGKIFLSLKVIYVGFFSFFLFSLYFFLKRISKQIMEKSIQKKAKSPQILPSRDNSGLPVWTCVPISIILYQWDQLYIHPDFLFLLT